MKLTKNDLKIILQKGEGQRIDPCKFFQSAYVDAVIFKGTERVNVIDRKIFKGGLFENLNSARIYLQEHLNMRYEYRDDWRVIVGEEGKMSVKSVGKMSVKSVGKKERKNLILKKIKMNEPFTLVTLAKEFGVNEKTIERDIVELKKAGKIRFVGPKRRGHYELLKNKRLSV